MHIYNYVTEKTFDAYMFQMLEKKQKFISQIMTSKIPDRSVEDIDEKALSYGEIKALATGDDNIKEKIELESEISKLNIIKQSYLSQKYDLEDKITRAFPEQISILREGIIALEKDVKILNENTASNKDEFSKMIINGEVYNEKESAGKKILEVCKTKNNANDEIIGEYRGFKMILGFDSVQRSYTMTMKNNSSYSIFLGADVYGNIQRIDNCLEKIESEIPKRKIRLDDINKQLEVAKVEVQKPFQYEEELNEKIKRLDNINILLKVNEKGNEAMLSEKEDDEDIINENVKKPKTKNYER